MDATRTCNASWDYRVATIVMCSEPMLSWKSSNTEVTAQVLAPAALSEDSTQYLNDSITDYAADCSARRHCRTTSRLATTDPKGQFEVSHWMQIRRFRSCQNCFLIPTTTPLGMKLRKNGASRLCAQKPNAVPTPAPTNTSLCQCPLTFTRATMS